MYLQNVVSGITDAWRLIEGVVFVGVIVFLPAGLLGVLQRRKKTVSLAGALATKKLLESAGSPRKAAE
jgi:hypothetical protein